MPDRRASGSWLDLAGLRRTTGAEGAVPGSRLGLPAAGPGSLAGLGRRVAALAVDWVVSLLVARLLVGAMHPLPGPAVRQFAPLAVFAVMTVLLVATTGSSIGHRLLGLGVRRLDGGRLPAGRVLVRTVLVCLALPPLTALVDPDQRGLHDQVAGSVVLRVT